MSTYRVLFLTDRGERHQQAALAAAPPNLEVIMRRAATLPDLLPLLPTVDFLISERNQPVTADMIHAAPRLRLIVRLGSLANDIDLEVAREARVQVVVQPVLGAIYAAEHALMMILAVLKKLGRSLGAAISATHGLPAQRGDENTFSFNWLGYTDIGGLVGKTVAIVGMGEIGAELARMLRGMWPGAVLYHKRRRYPASVEQQLDIRYADMEACLRQADVLVCLLPYSAETDYRNGGGLSAARLAMLRPSAALVHLGSGSVLDESALIAMLRAGRLAGAALDTYEYEPLQADHPLVQLARDPNSNLLLTPHTAGAFVAQDRSTDYAAILSKMSES